MLAVSDFYFKILNIIIYWIRQRILVENFEDEFWNLTGINSRHTPGNIYEVDVILAIKTIITNGLSMFKYLFWVGSSADYMNAWLYLLSYY